MPRPTKTDQALAAAAEAHAEDPERSEVLQRARRFKTSWVELAESLVDVRRRNLWQTWGHESFEAYARTELHLRQDTVDKLTRSFTFLKTNAPKVLERDGVNEPIPSLKAVEFLRRAQEESEAPPEVKETLRKRVLDENVRPERIAKEYGPTVFPLDPAARAAQDLSGLRNVASRLRALVEGTDVLPKRLSRDVMACLDELLAAVAPREDAA